MSPKRLLPTLALIALFAVPATASAGDAVIKIKDACDPATFNAVLGDGACAPINNKGGRVEFEELVGGEIDKWKFSERKLTIDEGESVRVRFERGGEAHSFTEVPQFGAGCVPELNLLVGYSGDSVAGCGLIEPTIVGPMRTRYEVAGLSSGVHRFECLIHPWMQSVVEVRGDDDDDRHGGHRGHG
jgi:hypothetical protein